MSHYDQPVCISEVLGLKRCVTLCPAILFISVNCFCVFINLKIEYLWNFAFCPSNLVLNGQLILSRHVCACVFICESWFVDLVLLLLPGVQGRHWSQLVLQVASPFTLWTISPAPWLIDSLCYNFMTSICLPSLVRYSQSHKLIIQGGTYSFLLSILGLLNSESRQGS